MPHSYPRVSPKSAHGCSGGCRIGTGEERRLEFSFRSYWDVRRFPSVSLKCVPVGTVSGFNSSNWLSRLRFFQRIFFNCTGQISEWYIQLKLWPTPSLVLLLPYRSLTVNLIYLKGINKSTLTVSVPFPGSRRMLV